ncbi:MAG TPA: prolipoprotein diacylglyceryl transferase family protein [Candidatus Saccharimonadales bacterium]|nr:prolipoprotein diacylglyceryl transferase family protein [Candidatus Saccharimonadales bacterium]
MAPIISALTNIAYPAGIFLGILFFVFLFWRACRHELFDSEEAFDLILAGSSGAFVFARVFDFAFREGVKTFSRFVFFNRYGGFDFWGALLGLFVGLVIFSKFKKVDVKFALDLFAAPIAFFQFLISLGSYISSRSNLDLFSTVGFLVIFIILKRLATKVRHKGFFALFYLSSTSALELMLFKFKDNLHYIGKIPYELASPGIFFVLAIVVWYVFAKRKLKADVRDLLGFLMLSVFRFFRMIRSADEAGRFSKSVILFPYYIARTIFFVFVTMGKEIKASLLELLYVFGLRRFFK